MRIHRTGLGLSSLMLAALACGPAGGAVNSPTSPAPTLAGPTTAPASQATSAPASSDIDVSSYIACEIVTAQDVADLVGGPIYRELEQEPGPGCIYEVEAGPDGYAQFIVYVQPPNLIEAMIETLPEELGQPVAGVGDEAFLDYNDGSETYDLVVLVRGRFGLEVIGEGEDWVRGIGELFLSRLVGP